MPWKPCCCGCIACPNLTLPRKLTLTLSGAPAGCECWEGEYPLEWSPVTGFWEVPAATLAEIATACSFSLGIQFIRFGCTGINTVAFLAVFVPAALFGECSFSGSTSSHDCDPVLVEITAAIGCSLLEYCGDGTIDVTITE